MNKKILDVTAVVIFSFCLIVAANIKEWNTKDSHMDAVAYVSEEVVGETNHTVTAGVTSVLFGYSFTTESDEKTVITKNGIDRVMTQEEMSREENSLEKTLSEEIIQKETIPPDTVTVPEEENPIPAGESNETAAETAAWRTGNNRWNIVLTEEEIDLLARIVWLEACGEPVEGQQAVVEVIFNRIASQLYPNTLYEVLSQRNPVQFCSWKNRDIAKPTEKEYQSIREVLSGNTNILRNDTLYFSTEPLTSRVDARIGGHSFCY